MTNNWNNENMNDRHSSLKEQQSSCNSQSLWKPLSLEEQEMITGGTFSSIYAEDNPELEAAADTVRIPVRIKYEL